MARVEVMESLVWTATDDRWQWVTSQRQLGSPRGLLGTWLEPILTEDLTVTHWSRDGIPIGVPGWSLLHVAHLDLATGHLLLAEWFDDLNHDRLRAWRLALDIYHRTASEYLPLLLYDDDGVR